MQAVILAGGKGTRLRPFTTFLPKPLVPIDNVPILEIVLRQLKHYGFRSSVLAVNHLAELIMTFFGTGEKIGIDITYSREDKPLGTAGPLTIIPNLEENFLVMNGDLLTTIDYKKLFDSHVAHSNDITICTTKREVKIDLGVLEIEDMKFIDYKEKPTLSYWVSTGIYIINKKVVSAIPHGVQYDMPTLVLRMKNEGKKIGCYTDDFFWLDIGRVEDYETAVKIYSDRKNEFLPHG